MRVRAVAGRGRDGRRCREGKGRAPSPGGEERGRARVPLRLREAREGTSGARVRWLGARCIYTSTAKPVLIWAQAQVSCAFQGLWLVQINFSVG